MTSGGEGVVPHLVHHWISVLYKHYLHSLIKLKFCWEIHNTKLNWQTTYVWYIYNDKKFKKQKSYVRMCITFSIHSTCFSSSWCLSLSFPYPILGLSPTLAPALYPLLLLNGKCFWAKWKWVQARSVFLCL